jgi:hypothetical protein
LYRVVVENDFCKRLCERLCPEAATFTSAVEVSRSAPLPLPPPAPAPAPAPESSAARAAAEAQFRIYSYLCGQLAAAHPSVDCILHCVGASSTDNFPDETMENTLEPMDRINHRPSYWSSAGQDQETVPESLVYRLASDICVVHEIRIQPFQGTPSDNMPFIHVESSCFIALPLMIMLPCAND